MFYSTRNPECSGNAPPVKPETAATQWTHSVPRQMPWTLASSQRTFSRNMPIDSPPFLPPHAPLIPSLVNVPIAASVASVDQSISGQSHIGYGVNLPQESGVPLPVAFSDKVLPGHTTTNSSRGGSFINQAAATPYNVRLSQMMLPSATAPTSTGSAAGLPRALPRQIEANQKLLIYPGDPCTSSAPQMCSTT
ncbi:hypothetical protein BIW11_11001, partial [Tropilaelaps mercedesae]